MSDSRGTSLDALQGYRRRSLIAVVSLIALLGGTGLALILSPRGAVGRSSVRGAWLIPVAIVIVIAAIQSSLRGRRWNPASPEVLALMEDEFRRVSMDRAFRIAFIAVLAAQWPFALAVGFLADLPGPRPAMAMAAASITFGLLIFLVTYLYLDRD